MTYQRAVSRREVGDLATTSEALARMVGLLDELDHDGLDLTAGISASAEYGPDGEPTGNRVLMTWVEVSHYTEDAASQ